MNATMLLITAVAAFLLPLTAAVIWTKKFHGKVIPILVGALTFFLFANVLESILHVVCLMLDNPVSRFLNSHIWALALYGAFAAGIFEETGRLLAFTTVLRKYKDRETAVSYGIGHGGIEVILVLGINYLLMAIALLTAGSEAGSSLAALLPGAASITPSLCCIAVLERATAMLFHVSASIIVFCGVKNPAKRHYYPLAILLHALLDLPAAFYQQGFLTIGAAEAVITAFTVLAAVFAKKVYKKLQKTIYE